MTHNLQSHKTVLFLLIFLTLFTFVGCVAKRFPDPTLPLTTPAVTLLRTQPRLYWPAAHRGDIDRDAILTGSADNAVSSFNNSVEHKVPFIEMDVREGADKQLFLFHDHTVQTSNISNPGDLLGKKFELLTTEQRNSLILPNKKDHIPLFKDALRIVADTNTGILVDVKTHSFEVLDKIAKEALELHAEKAIVYQLREIEDIAYVRSHYPTLAILARCFTMKDIDAVASYHPEIIQLDIEDLPPTYVQRVREIGSKLLVKTLGPWDGPLQWSRAFMWGADIVLTDHAARLLP